ncbi:MAG TPA: hypothetical protein VMU87_13870 [Stellaceae bacterium]|nr:hypothetical protein [Stellaceae bacterium]
MPAVRNVLMVVGGGVAGMTLAAALERFMARRYTRCRMVVEASHQMALWDRHPGTNDAEPVGVVARTNASLAEPI